jgi:hypothetical protein
MTTIMAGTSPIVAEVAAVAGMNGETGGHGGEVAVPGRGS